MSRSLIRRGLASVAALGAGACMAQSSVSMYGLVDLAAGRFHSAGGLKTWRIDGNGMSQSFEIGRAHV